MTAAALAAGLAQTGGVVALPRGGPDRPRRTLGLGRLFDGARTASLLVGLVTATLMVAFAGQATLDWLPSVATLLDVPQRAPEVTGSGLSRILLVAAAVVATCAAGDWLVRRELWLRRHRMSREELRRERREEEGAPEMRRARERLHEGLARGDVREGQRVGPRRDHPGPR
jgi:type III secretion protein U